MSPATRSSGRGRLRPVADQPSLLAGLQRLARLDFAPVERQASAGLVVLATAVALGGSLLACAGIVAAAKALFPSTAHFSHTG